LSLIWSRVGINELAKHLQALEIDTLTVHTEPDEIMAVLVKETLIDERSPASRVTASFCRAISVRCDGGWFSLGADIASIGIPINTDWI
jgi:hypothetical protein